MTLCFLVLVEILQKIVESVLADESFKLPSPLAANALLAAEKLAALFGTNQLLILEFAERLVSTLMPTFGSKASSCKLGEKGEHVEKVPQHQNNTQVQGSVGAVLTKIHQLGCITYILPVCHRCGLSGVDSRTILSPKKKCRAR